MSKNQKLKKLKNKNQKKKYLNQKIMLFIQNMELDKYYQLTIK